MSSHPFKQEDIQDLPYETPDGFEEVRSEEIDSKSRWSFFCSRVLKDVNTGKLWKISWSRGVSEYQDNGPEDIEIDEVVAVEVTSIVYKKVSTDKKKSK